MCPNRNDSRRELETVKNDDLSELSSELKNPNVRIAQYITVA